MFQIGYLQLAKKNSTSTEQKIKVVIIEFFRIGYKMFDIIENTGYASRTFYRFVPNTKEGEGIGSKAGDPMSVKVQSWMHHDRLLQSIAGKLSHSFKLI